MGEHSYPVAVVGAGVSGLACAHALHEQGVAVRVFDKSRGPGGRISTRRADGWAFDHGAQYFTRRDNLVFGHHVDAWLDARVVSVWDGRFAVLGEQGPGSMRPADPEVRYVGIGGMSAITRHFAATLDVQYGTRVATCRRSNGAWHLQAEDGADLGLHRYVVVAVPAPQAAALVAGTAIEDAVRRVELAPCWAVMAGFGEPLAWPFDAAFVHGSPLAFVARCSSKPGWPGGEAWVLHASASWTREHLEQSPDETVGHLLAALSDVLSVAVPAPNYVAGHRWRYASTPAPLGTRCLVDDDARIAACGDWCVGSRIEGAFMSGLSAASAVLSQLSQD